MTGYDPKSKKYKNKTKTKQEPSNLVFLAPKGPRFTQVTGPQSSLVEGMVGWFLIWERRGLEQPQGPAGELWADAQLYLQPHLLAPSLWPCFLPPSGQVTKAEVWGLPCSEAQKSATLPVPAWACGGRPGGSSGLGPAGSSCLGL